MTSIPKASTHPACGIPAAQFGSRGEERTRPVGIAFHDWGYRRAGQDRFIFRHLTLTIPAGQHVLLLGASGIGKSTLLGAMAGLVGSSANSVDEDGGTTEGRLLVNNVPADSAMARGKTALVLQDPFSQAVLQRVGDNAAFGLENLGVPRSCIWPRVKKALKLVGLGGLELTRQTAYLSGGQMQRLALAGALCMHPGALLLDEPTANLDPPGAQEVSTSIRTVLHSHPSTLVLVEHRAEKWLDMIDRVILLGPSSSPDASARIVADGTPDEVFDSGLDFDRLGIWVPKKYAAGHRQQEEIDDFRQNMALTVKRNSRGHGLTKVAKAQSDPAQSDLEAPKFSSDTTLFSHSRGRTVVVSTRDLAIGRNKMAIASHISLDFQPGTVTAIVGPNGVGKTTFALTLSGLLDPVAGKIQAGQALSQGLASSDPRKWSSRELATRISYVFQAPEHQFVRSKVLDEAMTGPLAAGKLEPEAREIAEKTLHRVGLQGCENRSPYSLSGGQKRRLTVASALAASPRVLVLDEPTFGQDRLTWGEMARLIRKAADQGVCVIMVTHDQELVRAVADRVIHFRMGGISKAGGGAQPASHAGCQVGKPVLYPDKKADSGARTEVFSTPTDTRHEKVRAASPSRFVRTLNPASRLLAAICLSVPIVLTLDVVSAATFFVLVAITLLCLGFTPKTIFRHTWPVWVAAPWSFLAILLYGKPGGHVFLDWGWIDITQRSLSLGIATALRVLAAAIPAVLLLIGIDTTDLADALSQVLHLPDRFVYGGLAGTRMVSVLRDDWTALGEARRSRGLGEQSRLARFFPQAFALLVLSIRRSTQLATAMEARGFGGTTPRTHARLSLWHKRDGWFVAGSLLVPTLAVLVAVFAGTFAFLGGH